MERTAGEEKQSPGFWEPAGCSSPRTRVGGIGASRGVPEAMKPIATFPVMIFSTAQT
jgi:hypothetical protein